MPIRIHGLRGAAGKANAYCAWCLLYPREFYFSRGVHMLRIGVRYSGRLPACIRAITQGRISCCDGVFSIKKRHINSTSSSSRENGSNKKMLLALSFLLYGVPGC